LPSTVRDFVEVWQNLTPEGRNQALTFLVKAHGNKLVEWIRFLQSVDNNIQIEKGNKN
jgi:hypothetical protein